ncbi:class I SAM-dependent methyltransferase [Nonomuraea insulae]|uniref:Class I SAM-dependent methyltransferase n=1 Tax=Nonomuraea insulae TaxID=1616787 RepID=A0ABW1CHN1_9ACTN
MRNSSLHQHHHAAHGPHDLHAGPPKWEEVYADRPRWDIGRPQPAFLALAEAGSIGGRVLDVGCGTGEHVLMCAGIGLEATGVDVAASAIRAAEQKAAERALTARFLHHDVRRLGELEEFSTPCSTAGCWSTSSTTLTDEDGVAAWLVALTRT